jgi:hypothetical protein
MNPAGDSYSKAASKWNQTAQKKEELRNQGSAKSFAAVVAQLCTNKVNSQFPPRERLVKFLRSAPNYLLEDVEEICDQLINKLEDRLWQVHAKSMSVMESLLNDPSCESYHRYLSACPQVYSIMEAFEQRSSKPAVRTKATAVLELLRKIPQPELHQQVSNDASQSAGDSGLLDGWIEQLDQASGKAFYFHAESGKTQWEKPAAPEPEPVPAPVPAPPAEVAVSTQAPAIEQLEEGWTEQADQASGKTFYFHAESGKTQWEKPVVFVPAPAPAAAPAAPPAPVIDFLSFDEPTPVAGNDDDDSTGHNSTDDSASAPGGASVPNDETPAPAAQPESSAAAAAEVLALALQESQSLQKDMMATQQKLMADQQSIQQLMVSTTSVTRHGICCN